MADVREERVDAAQQTEERSRRKEKKMKTKKKKKPLEVRVEAVPDSADHSAPLVGYFASGFNPRRGGEDVGCVESQVRVYRNSMRPSRLELVVRPRNADGSASNVEFVGSSYSGEAAQPQVCTYALGVLDKERQTLRIVPIAANKIFRLEPRVIHNVSAGVGREDEENKEFNAEARREKMTMLTNLYGSKKAKGMAQKFSKLKQQQNDPNAKDRLENQMKDVKINKEALERDKDKGETSWNIPPHDLTATQPEKAYILDEIINKWEKGQLLDVLRYMESEETTIGCLLENGYPSFVCNRVQTLRQIQDEEEKRQLAVVSSYITHLLKFLEMASESGKPLAMARGDSWGYRGIPRHTYNKFVKLFADPETFTLSNERKDLLIGYVLVLTLFVDGFKTEPSDIARDLKMTLSSLKPHYQRLGCTLSRRAKSRTAIITLPVPLSFPEEPKAKRKRRR